MEKEQLSAEERNEIVKYGLERGKIAVTSMIVTLIIGHIFEVFYQSIIFLIVFCLLRRYAGGYHADSQGRCYVISFISIIISFWCMKQIDYKIAISFIFQTLSMIFILLFSPVENKNRKLEKIECLMYRSKTRIIAIIIYAFSCCFYLSQNNIIIAPILMAYLLVMISLLLGQIKNFYGSK